MRFQHQFFYLIVIFTLLLTPGSLMAEEKIVIAHRGASGYLMEHNLPSVVLAVTMGADYIEQDLVMTKDDHLIVVHDLYLNRVTNVSELFPGREREDGKFYAIDFTLAEIKQLTLKEPSNDRSFKNLGNPGFTIPTFEEELILIRRLEKALKKTIGIYPEIKKPWFHKKHGKDITMAVLKTLVKFGYGRKDDKLFLQCFDHAELKRIHNDLFSMMGVEFKLIQLIDHNDGEETMSENGKQETPYNYDWMFSKFGLKALSLTVSGIGLEKSMLVDDTGTSYRDGFIKAAHSLGLQIHVYTFRADAGELPSYAAGFDELLDLFLFKTGVDGLFTDHCADVVHFLNNRDDDTDQLTENKSTDRRNNGYSDQ